MEVGGVIGGCERGNATKGRGKVVCRIPFRTIGRYGLAWLRFSPKFVYASRDRMSRTEIALPRFCLSASVIVHVTSRGTNMFAILNAPQMPDIKRLACFSTDRLVHDPFGSHTKFDHALCYPRLMGFRQLDPAKEGKPVVCPVLTERLVTLSFSVRRELRAACLASGF